MEDKINIFKSLFKGREDVFAIRWEKGNKAGYMPAVVYDPYFYRIHKYKKDTENQPPEKNYLPFDDEQILRHLNGHHQVGIYPLLKDNTSWFIAADFDKENWVDECRIFMKFCETYQLPAYLERSRSGNGGHIWIFFKEQYPAVRSRKIILTLLYNSGIISRYDKNSSFDRLFPNQDFLSGRGFGNLIALPFYKPTFDEGNSCYIDIATLEPYSNQWKYLTEIQRVSTEQLDSLFHSISKVEYETSHEITDKRGLCISLGKELILNKLFIPLMLRDYLKEELNFINTEYIIKKKIGKNTHGIDQYFNFIDETENSLILPKGFTGRLLRYCREYKINFTFIDSRKKHDSVAFQFNGQFIDFQIPAIEAASKKDFGIIVAPPATGKTIIGLKIIADRQQPALVVVHRKTLVDQWAERIEAFLGIPKNEIGKIGSGKLKIGNRITIATIQSLSKEVEKSENNPCIEAFGTVIVDECHHIPAETYRKTIGKLNCFYMYGFTATPFRKYSDGKSIFIYLGDIISEINNPEKAFTREAKVIIRETEFDIPFNSKTDQFETLSKMLVQDSARNKQILSDVTRELKSGKKAVIITERREHIDSLYQFLKQSFEVVTLSGEDSEGSRELKWRTLKNGNYQVLITTGQFFGEGTDLQNANCLFLVYPFSFKGKLIQYIGRVQRSTNTPTIYDYRDNRISYLEKLFLKRNTWYRKIGKQATLFDDPDEEIQPINKGIRTFEKNIFIPIETLDFRYGGIAFKFTIPDLQKELEFEIENDALRPEFEVLKPYFSKVLHSKNISAQIHVEFEYGKLVSQLATSTEVDRINREIIEGVRFRYFSKKYLGKNFLPGKADNLLDSKHLQTEGELYSSGEELVGDILNQKNYKHSRYLRYLANNHESTIFKIRFVLHPFSFVFLLKGEDQLHFIMETLDTEEATYIWHYDKTAHNLPDILKEINNHLSIIRNLGRQAFLEHAPSNFSRIVHDYSDEKKGFINWKDALEETLV